MMHAHDTPPRSWPAARASRAVRRRRSVEEICINAAGGMLRPPHRRNSKRHAISRSITRSSTTSPSWLPHTATRTSAPTGRCLRPIYRTARACKL